jgi:hypothetical protein
VIRKALWERRTWILFEPSWMTFSRVQENQAGIRGGANPDARSKANSPNPPEDYPNIKDQGN